jgi:hypothetical protein
MPGTHVPSVDPMAVNLVGPSRPAPHAVRQSREDAYCPLSPSCTLPALPPLRRRGGSLEPGNSGRRSTPEGNSRSGPRGAQGHRGDRSGSAGPSARVRAARAAAIRVASACSCAATHRGNHAAAAGSLVEHAFTAEKRRMGLVVRCIGLARATARITLANLAYNMRRLARIEGRGAPA